MKGCDETERVQVRFSKEQFEHEIRDLARHNVASFYTSQAFLRGFRIEDDGRHITTVGKV